MEITQKKKSVFSVFKERKSLLCVFKLLAKTQKCMEAPFIKKQNNITENFFFFRRKRYYNDITSVPELLT